MASFKDKIKDKKTIGQRQINSDEAIGLAFNEETTKKLVQVKISALSQNPYQPRKSMNNEEIQGLSESISKNGLLQPILISSIENNPHKFYIVAGHRRVEAAKLLNEDTISAIIVQMNNTQLEVNALVENIQRENLTSIEESFAIKSLLDSGIKQVELAKILGKSKAVISTFIKISTLDKELLSYIQDNNLDIGRTILYELTNVITGKQLQAMKHIHDEDMKRDKIRDYVKKLNGIEDEKVSPAKLFNGFSFSHKKNKISFKLDLEKLDDKQEAIATLEDILKELQND
ncbi:MAG: ParB/RepB/Spo0J family partition protein [Sulfurimonas sp.]|nr:ParB/RepB/Spo0J family partition protein [Sulfurimonas sp.]